MGKPKMDPTLLGFVPHLDHSEGMGVWVGGVGRGGGFFATFLVLIARDPDAHGSSQEQSLYQENCDYKYDSKEHRGLMILL